VSEYEPDPCDPPAIVFREPIVVQADYDPDNGVLTFDDGMIRRAVEVRRHFEELATRKAAIVELERLGYTITPPGIDLERLLAEHQFVGVVDGWAVCLCGWTAATDRDDDEGTHAHHQMNVISTQEPQS